MRKFVVVVTSQEDKFLARVLPSTGLTIGAPRREPIGVPQRRSMWVHDFTEQEIIDIEDIGRVNGMVLADLIKDVIPPDWRF